MRVVVLGAGFGGLELSTRLSEELGADADVVLIDRSEGFVFGFSKLDVMFGRTTPEAVTHSYADLAHPGVSFVQATITSIDPGRRVVGTDAGEFEADILVVALGAALDPSDTPGLVEAGHEFYTNAGAFAVRDVLQSFEGGRVLVGVTSTPYKCPPAPSETVLMLDHFLREKGLRDKSEIAFLSAMGAPIPPSPEASTALLAEFAEREIEWHPNSPVTSLDPERKVAVLAGGSEMAFDLFLGVPRHRAPAVVSEAGMCEDGWIPVDPLTLETSFPGVYAVGDCTSAGTPKAGMFAEGQAKVVAEAILARLRGEETDARYGGHGTCYIEFGGDRVARVDVHFRAGERPFGTFEDASELLVADKGAFGADRIRRWFGKEWVAH